jgi:putative pyruvate formate lyase activating enzyme
MICAEPKPVFRTLPSRRALARERAIRARAMLADCRLCAHNCGVNRLAGETGLCHAGAESRFFSAQVEVSDELELIPTFAVALSGCDLRCDFCITGAESWNPRAGLGFDAAAMAERAEAALHNGARTVMVLGGEPTIHLPGALELVSHLPESAKLVWKTNAHGSAQARELLDGMFDVWLADFKFGNDACAQRLAKVPDYIRVVQENLLWFADQPRAEHRCLKRRENVGVQASACSEDTLKREPQRSELIVRHLLMPRHVDCCWKPVAEWLAENLPGVKVNLRSGFWPAWHAARHEELRGTVSRIEMKSAWAIARDYNLDLVN